MIDFLCLKLGWKTDDVLDNAHFDNERKFYFYNLLDNVERTRILPALPVGFDKKVSRKVSQRHKGAISELNKYLRGTGIKTQTSEGSESENPTFDMFGSKERAQKFFDDLHKGKLPMKRLGGM